MRTALFAFALSVFRRLPVPLRRAAVRLLTPSYVVGAAVVIRDEDTGVLLLRERHHEGWSVPGGLLGRRERPADAAVREVSEELDITITSAVLIGPTVVVDPVARRVDVVYTTTLAHDVRPVACPPEVLEIAWFAPDALPELFEPTLAVLRAVGVGGHVRL